MKKILLSVLFVLIVAIVLLPHNVFALIDLDMYVADGVLYWEPVTDSSCKGYEICIYDSDENEITYYETSQRLASSFRINEVMVKFK